MRRTCRGKRPAGASSARVQFDKYDMVPNTFMPGKKTLCARVHDKDPMKISRHRAMASASYVSCFLMTFSARFLSVAYTLPYVPDPNNPRRRMIMDATHCDGM